jgi:hypothetical protein
MQRVSSVLMAESAGLALAALIISKMHTGDDHLLVDNHLLVNFLLTISYLSFHLLKLSTIF